MVMSMIPISFHATMEIRIDASNVDQLKKDEKKMNSLLKNRIPSNLRGK